MGCRWRIDDFGLAVVADVFTKKKRSAVMARIRSTGNKETELAMILLFREGGIVGWRRNWPLPGRPDFAFPKLRLALFVDGCFWHGCPVHGRLPTSNCAYWTTKLGRNRQRDREVNRRIKLGGWKVVRIWHHELGRNTRAHCLARVKHALRVAHARTRKKA